MKMDTEEFVQSLRKMPQSAENKEFILRIVDKGGISMESLIRIFNDSNLFTCQKAGWVLQIIAGQRSHLLIPYEEELIKGLNNAPHDAYIRNTVRLFQELDVSEDMEGLLYDKCFYYLTSFKSPVAVKAFSLTVLRKMALRHPDLIQELIVAIEGQLEFGTSGFKNRAYKELKILQKKKAEFE